MGSPPDLALYPLLCPSGGCAMPRGPAIPQMAKPTTGSTRITTAHPSLVPERLLVRHTLLIAHRSINNTVTAAAIQNTVEFKGFTWLGD